MRKNFQSLILIFIDKFIFHVCFLYLINCCLPKQKRKMTKTYITIWNKDYLQRENLFLKDPKSDLFVILKEKIYPLHKKFLVEAEYFFINTTENQKVHVINEPDLEVLSIFEAIIGYLYGKKLQFFRNWDILKLLKAINALKIGSLFQKIMDDLKENFDQYGFFLLMTIGEEFNIKWLREKYQQELLLMGFEQLNYNRYDLMQVNREMFQEIVKLHELLKINQNILGLKQLQIKKIIKQYCNVNNIPEVQINKICQMTVSSPHKPLKIKLSETLQKKITQTQQNKIIRRPSQNSKSDKKIQQNEQISKLKTINSELKQKNSQLVEEIRSVKSKLIQNQTKGGLNQNFSIKNQNINLKIKAFQNLFEQQNIKFDNLKAQIQKRNQILPHSGRDQRPQVYFSIIPYTFTDYDSNKVKSLRDLTIKS